MNKSLFISFALLAISSAFGGSKRAPIDRHALVSRHNITRTGFDPNRPLQVGNGEFAFGMDATGLQTFVPFNTMSHWAWHSLPLPAGQSVADFKGQVWDTHGRPVRYPMPDPDHPELSDWMAGNPHAINLGRIGLNLLKKDGTPAAPSDLQQIRQELDLWTGIVTSHFLLEGTPVTVTTACHPSLDLVAAKVESPLISAKRLSVFFDCPEDDGKQFATYVGDPGRSALPKMTVAHNGHRADFARDLGPDSYHASVNWKGSATLVPPQPGDSSLQIVKADYRGSDKSVDVTDAVRRFVHDGRLTLHVDNTLGGDPQVGAAKKLTIDYTFQGKPSTAEAVENDDIYIDPTPERRRYTFHPENSGDSFSFTCAFSRTRAAFNIPNADATFEQSKQAWPAFWKSGGAIDLSESKDPRWKELERRIVLSQYLMAVNEAGGWPPQESGLVNNGWFGRFHLEMYWWHAAHWALWNRWSQLNRSLGFYKTVLPKAEARAVDEGFKGARWPKCIGPNVVEWPHIIHSLLIWQQPHPLFFAELDYRAHPTRATLEKWRPIVEATADFLSTYAFYEKAKDRYVLGPPLVLVSENTDPKTTQNPTFELGYFKFGLRIAQQWRERLHLPRRAEWDEVLRKLAPLPQQDGLYVLHEGVKNMWTEWNFEHPALTGAFGMLPGDGVDPETMKRTLAKVSSSWNFNHVWGWDFPMLAMCAARLGEPNQALDFLLYASPNFDFDELGLATGGPYPYFPSNGGLLYAVAMMAAGWEGAKGPDAPGFPKDGNWKVRWEGLSPAP